MEKTKAKEAQGKVMVKDVKVHKENKPFESKSYLNRDHYFLKQHSGYYRGWP